MKGRDTAPLVIMGALWILLALVLSNCSYPGTQPKCRQYAVLQALTYYDLERYPVRIWIGITPSGKTHSQAQAFIDNEWEWLIINKYGRVDKGKQDNFEPTKCMKVSEFLEIFLIVKFM